MTNIIRRDNPIILSVDTSCDETSVSVTNGLTVLSNVVWSQSKVHAKFGGVVPNEARREHENKIHWVYKRALFYAKIQEKELDAVSVTVGPGLAIALGVGINFAKDLAGKYSKPLIAVNHLEGHLLSPLARAKNFQFPISNFQFKNKREETFSYQPPTSNNQPLTFPAFGIVVSGGNTLLVLIEKIGKYKILAQTIDDALGESLDKSARLLGLGYPGGAILEIFARKGNSKKYPLPLPMLGRENEGFYSYSGIKTAFSRMVNKLLTGCEQLDKQQIYDLAASYQHTAFEHFIRVTRKTISATIPIYNIQNTTYLFVGGGVAANANFRRRIRMMCKQLGITPLFPYAKKLYGDNAAMIGAAAYFKYLKKDFIDPKKIDRIPDLKIGNAVRV